MAFIAEVIGDLDLERSLHQPLCQLAEQTAGPDDLLLAPRTRQELVNDLVRELASDLIAHAIKDPRRGRRLAWRLAGAIRSELRND